jgi:hypothetical protein
MADHQDQTPDDAYIDLADIARRFWESRLLIVLGTLALCVLAGAGSWFLSKYQSDGLFQLQTPNLRYLEGAKGGETTISLLVGPPAFSDFKRANTALLERERLERFLAKKDVANDPDLARLPTRVASKLGLSGLVEQQYVLSKADAKELADPTLKEGATQLMGIRLQPEANTPQAAQKQAKILAEYVRDTMFHASLLDYYRSRESELKVQLLAHESTLLTNKFSLKQLQSKSAEMRAISAKYPEASRIEARSVVSLSDTTVRYLPPTTQLIAIETNISDVNLAIERSQRERDQNELLLLYYTAMRDVAEKAATGEEVVKQMAAVKQESTKGKDVADEKYRQALNTIDLEMTRLVDGFFKGSRFISGPTLPEHKTGRPLLVLALTAVGGFLLMCFVALLRSWFRQNSAKILG